MNRFAGASGVFLSVILAAPRAPAQSEPAPPPLEVLPAPPASPPVAAPSPAPPPTSAPVVSPRVFPSYRRPNPSGWEIGLRTGYGLPFGSADGQTPMTDLLTGVAPLWVDLGYRSSPFVYEGAYFEYGFGTLNTDSGKPENACGDGGLSCSTNDVRFGLEFDIHLAPEKALDPWFGVGTGFELQTVSLTGPAASASINTFGVEYLNLQFGGNWNVGSGLAVGPFVSFSLDQFDSIDTSATSGVVLPAGGQIADKALHEWVTLGVRATYDFFRIERSDAAKVAGD